jgi:NADPH:quinone reductase-like Zn-dependent oxidoreductase
VLAATGGAGVNLVVNNVGGTVFAECVRCLAFEGRLATVGYVDGGAEAEIDLQALHAKRLVLFGVSQKMTSARAEGRGRCAASAGDAAAGGAGPAAAAGRSRVRLRPAARRAGRTWRPTRMSARS